MDLIDDPQPGRNVPEFTVTDLAGRVKRLVERELGYVRVRGEVGRVVLARSGHLYFDLKDDRNVLSCMTWKGQVAGLGLRPEEGMEVVAEGQMTASGFQSKFALNATRLQLAGEGALMAMLERRRKALAAEGLFDDGRKKPLPYLPHIIGVVTSPQGAVIRDILHRLRDRFPRKVLVWPVLVQGQGSAEQVARAIEGFNALTPGGALPRPDLLIVARGGGSVEDLWCFNEEVVVRAAAASDIPLISAVGHETDTTLIDHAADRRAPTPTAAAEMAVPVRRDLLAWCEEQGARMTSALNTRLDQRRQRLADLARALPTPDRLFDGARQRIDRADADLPRALLAGIRLRRLALSEAGALRPSLLTARLSRAADMLATRAAQLDPALHRAVRQRRDALDRASARLVPPRTALSRNAADLDRLAARLVAVGAQIAPRAAQRLDAQARLLETLSHRGTLARGYAIVRGDGEVVTTAKAASKAQSLEIEFRDGVVTPGAPAAAPKPKARKPKPPPPEQGTLL
ncbi:exodeoxyribonuclease VII large subunit [Pseudaestuariivita atlantica]|uniref:Exodeoxyribonuclease 7 large subunit n=1 Tax=Pseudaestuariivita atlantica TaxID=1317121 RepID=A0A0L1JKR9_9RHOB|nr:exodeoxyribonuclease VII large subunit [Pseudaestuariivita atlantica]KNG92322.1 exodeoxyribonuclease VII large subunit [Pseudaestuariivita atlantica]